MEVIPVQGTEDHGLFSSGVHPTWLRGDGEVSGSVAVTSCVAKGYRCGLVPSGVTAKVTTVTNQYEAGINRHLF